MSGNVQCDRLGLPDSGKEYVGTPRSWRDYSIEARLSPQHVNHVTSSSSSLIADSHRANAAQTTLPHHAEVQDRTKRLTSFSVVDILGPRYGGSAVHHHHHQHQHRHSSGENNDDVESTSTRSNEDLSSSVLSHDSSTDGPSPTGSNRSHYWAETETPLSTSRKL